MADTAAPEAECNTSVLSDITLLIHCRQKPHICQLRRRLMESYSTFFRKVVVLLRHFKGAWPGTRPCEEGPGDPHFCVASEMSTSTARGIMYMQFDVALSPCGMGRILDASMLGSFSSWKYKTFEDCERCRKNPRLRCHWGAWQGPSTKTQLLSTVHDLEMVQVPGSWQALEEERAKAFEKLRQGLLGGSSDLLYVPREAFSVFVDYARIFKKWEVDMEIVQPTMLTLLPLVTGVGFQNFHCAGSCCQWVRKKQILSRDFVCGHRVDLANPESLGAILSLTTRTSRQPVREGRPKNAARWNPRPWGKRRSPAKAKAAKEPAPKTFLGQTPTSVSWEGPRPPSQDVADQTATGALSWANDSSRSWSGQSFPALGYMEQSIPAELAGAVATLLMILALRLCAGKPSGTLVPSF
ncbi:unnamed protein product [Symbiodinium natans]|uniref:Uncharacterized protein n=1 Tax=Symbiodinium natans TaxID=878477 RepID=A0A812SPN9_9DINO|nr:unnamed protein product [Symbiodinium natans]